MPATWFIDPLNGKDAFPGTSDKPLKTHEELRQRIGSASIEGDVEVILLNDFDSDNPVVVDFTLGRNASLTYRGNKTLTTLHTGAFTDVVSIDRPNNQAMEVGDSSLAADWEPSGLINSSADLPDGSLRRIRITGGANLGAIAYACKDLGAKRARTSPFGLPAALVGFPATQRLRTPVTGDPFVVESGFVLIDSFVVDIKISPIGAPTPPGKVHLLFIDLELNPNVVNNHHMRARAQPVFGGPGTIVFTGCGVGRISPEYANKVVFSFCRLGGTRQDFQATLVQLGGCCCLAEVAVFEGARVAAFADTIFQGSPLRLQGLGRLGDVSFFDTDGAAGLQVEPNGTAQVEAFFPNFGGGKSVYGRDCGATGAKVQAGGCIVYDGPEPNAAAAGLTVTGNLGDVDVAGTPSSWVAIAPDLAPPGKRAAVARND